jgi:hypothetical protein
MSRAYTTLIALVCAAAVAYAIHANGQAAKADRAALRARQFERDARATQIHRLQTAHSLQRLVHQYNAVARNATNEQRHLLAALSRARRLAAKERPSGAPAVEYSTQSIAIPAAPIAQAPPVAAAVPLAPSTPTTKTS